MKDLVELKLNTNEDHYTKREDKSHLSKRGHKTLVERFCSFYVKRPRLAFGLTVGFQLLLPILTGILYWLKFDVLPYDFTQVPLNIETDATKLRADAFNFASSDPRVDLQPATILGQPERSIRVSPIEFIYKAKNGNILSRKNLQDIKELENDLYLNPIYNKTCQLDFMSQRCLPPLSIIRFFDGSFRHLHKEFYDPNFSNIDNVLDLAKNHSKTRGLLAFSLDRHATLWPRNNKASYLRSMIFHGLPLRGYENVEDRKEEQMDQLKELERKAFSDILAKRYKDGVGDMRFYYISLPLFFDAVQHQVIFDLLLAAGSISFIFCYIWFQTASLWITCWALFGIITNFFGANLLYRFVLDFRYIGTFHVLSVFIILGIGADDIFVFYNTWKLMKQRKFRDLADHLTETFRCAAGAMFVTSLTTMAAFLASAASPLLGVSSFGVFSGILVIVNYCSVCVFFPSVVVMHHLYVRDRFCGRSKAQGSKESITCVGEEDSTVSPAMGEMFKKIVDWFQGPFVDYVVLHPVVKWACLSFFCIMSILFMAFAVQLKPDEEQVQVWPPGTNWHDVRHIRLNHFRESGEGSNVIRVYIIWGLELQDRSHCHFTDYKCKGKTVFDDKFDLNPPECQLGVLEFCKKLQNMKDDEAENLKIRRSVATGKLEVSCFMDRMNDYLKQEALNGIHRYKYPQSTNLSLPFDGTRAETIMQANPLMYNTSLVTSEYSRFFEVGLGYWLSEGARDSLAGRKLLPSYDYVIYGNWMGGALDPTAIKDNRPRLLALAQGGRHGNKLKYVAVVANTSLTGATLKYNLGNRVFKEWEKLMEKEMKKLPPTCRKAFQCTPEWNNWHWLKVQGVLLQGAIQGIIIGLSLALPVLVFTTCNWIIGILATLTIGLITLAVVGLIPMVGWKLGVMESLNLTLVVGLSVDYAVHLADGYVRSKRFKREDKVRDMLEHVGVSVLAGASTTLGASAFMLGAKIIFFFQFGIFMFCTIGFSILYALCFFTVVVGLVGPEGDQGSIKCLFPCFWKEARDQSDLALVMEDDMEDEGSKRNGRVVAGKVMKHSHHSARPECLSPTLLNHEEREEEQEFTFDAKEEGKY